VKIAILHQSIMTMANERNWVTIAEISCESFQKAYHSHRNKKGAVSSTAPFFV